MIEIISGNSRISEFIARLSGESPVEAFASIGQVKDGHLLTAGVIYTSPTQNDIGASIAVADGETLSRLFTFAMFHYPFVHMGKDRITVRIRESNIKSMRLASRLGFIQEGKLRKGYPDGEDMLVFGLVKEECRWLRMASRYGKD